jgi:hypothetical protein
MTMDTPTSIADDAVKSYPVFSDYMRATSGPGWSLGSPAASGATVLDQASFDAAQRIWAEGHPAYRLACTLPAGERRTFICDAVLRQLGVRNRPTRQSRTG